MAGVKKIEQVNELIKRELGMMLRREFDIDPDILLSITEVITEPDLLSAQIKISIWPESKSQEVFKKLDKATGFFQHLLIKKLRMKPIPRIHFSLDTRIKEAVHIEDLLEKVKDDEGDGLDLNK